LFCFYLPLSLFFVFIFLFLFPFLLFFSYFPATFHNFPDFRFTFSFSADMLFP